MRRYDVLRLVWIGLIVLAVPRHGLAAEKRVALVIGNSTYQHAPWLENPNNDAADIAAALQKLDFTVIAGMDLDKIAMDRRLREFAEALPGADVGVFFYAGHGLQVGSQNYLVPVDAKLATAAALDFELVRLDLVQRTMEREAKASVLFLDSCRNNPLAGSLARAMGTRSAEVGRGMAAAEAGIGTLVSFSTQPGNVALDGEGRNSPFAAALAKHIVTPGDDVATTLIKVRNDVVRATANRQVPWENSSLWARLYFTPPQTAAVEMPPPARPGTGPETQLEIAFWETVKDSGDPAVLRTYLDRFPQGAFAGLARVLIARAQRALDQRAMAAAKVEEDKGEGVRTDDGPGAAAQAAFGARLARESKTSASLPQAASPPCVWSGAKSSSPLHHGHPERPWKGRRDRQ